jgi:hypothetical protein
VIQFRRRRLFAPKRRQNPRSQAAGESRFIKDSNRERAFFSSAAILRARQGRTNPFILKVIITGSAHDLACM